MTEEITQGQPLMLKVHFLLKDNVDPTARVDLNKTIACLDTDTATQVVDKALDKLPERPPGEYILWHPSRRMLFPDNQIVALSGVDMTEPLDIRPRIQRFRCEMIDKTIKTYQIDVTLTVEKLVDFIGQKIDIKFTDEYGLKIYDETTKKENNQWLDPMRVFYEQINSEDVLLIRLKKRFYFRDKNVNDGDAQQLHLIYTDCSIKIADGLIPVTKDRAFNLAALRCVVEFESYQGTVADLDLKQPKGIDKKMPDIKKFFAEIYRKKFNVKDYVTVATLWKQLIATRVTPMQAKYRFCQMIMQEKTYGLETFKVHTRKVGKAKEIPRLFGICKDYVLLQDEDGENTETWAISKIARFAVGKSVFIIDLGNHSTTYITLITEEGDLISSTLSGYIDLITKRKKEQMLAEKEEEPDFSYTEKIEDVPAGETVVKKKKPVIKKSEPEVAAVAQVEEVAQEEQVQLCVDKYAQMSFEMENVCEMEFNAVTMVETAEQVGSLVSDLYSADSVVVSSALAALAKDSDVLYDHLCACKKADFGTCVMNADEEEEQMLVACRTMTEQAQYMVDNYKNGLQSAVLVQSAEEAEILPPEMFVMQASITSINAVCNETTINDAGSQMLLHELSRQVGEGLFDLAELCIEMNISGEKIVEANKALVELGKAEIAAMRLLAVTSSEEGCQKLMAEIKNTMDMALANYLSIVQETGLDPESIEMMTILDQVAAIKQSWEALQAGSEMSGLEADPQLLSMIQNLSAVFNELAQLSNPLVTPQQVEISIDNLEDILEGTKQTCKQIAQQRIDEGNPEQVAVILEAFKDVVNKFFIVRDKIEAGERGEMVEDDCIMLRQAMEKLMESCDMEDVGENMQTLTLNSMTKTAVARRIALAAQVRRAIKNKHIKDKNLQKQLLKASRQMADQIQEMLKLLALPVDEQTAKLPDKVKEFAPATYDLVCEVLDSLQVIEDAVPRNALEFACEEAEKATFDMANLNSLFNNTKQAKKDAVAVKKNDFDEIENEIELLLQDLEKESFEVQKDNAEQVRMKAKQQIEESIKALAEPLKKIRETPLEDLPALFEKIQAQVRKNYRACKAYASTAKKSDFRKRLLEASKRLADEMRNVVDFALDEKFDEIAKLGTELGEIWGEMDEVMKEINLDDIEEKQEQKEEEIQDAATKELVGAANVINNALGKINAALEYAKKKKEERERQLQAEQQALYDAAVAANEEAAKQMIVKKKTTKLDDSELDVMILEEAGSLISYTSELISVATEAQKIIAANQGEVVEKKDVYNKDANWEEGLISAAKTVTGCIQYLVKAANDQVIHNKPSEAMLVACAKSVAANAMQLQTASMVKMDQADPKRQQLAQCISKIVDSQNKFVKTVSAGADQRTEVPPPKVPNAQKLRIMLMEAQVNISNIEKELRQAQNELLQMRRARYGNANKAQATGGFAGANQFKGSAAQPKPQGIQRGFGANNFQANNANNNMNRPAGAARGFGGFAGMNRSVQNNQNNNNNNNQNGQQQLRPWQIKQLQQQQEYAAKKAAEEQAKAAAAANVNSQNANANETQTEETVKATPAGQAQIFQPGKLNMGMFGQQQQQEPVKATPAGQAQVFQPGKLRGFGAFNKPQESEQNQNQNQQNQRAPGKVNFAQFEKKEEEQPKPQFGANRTGFGASGFGARPRGASAFGGANSAAQPKPGFLNNNKAVSPKIEEQKVVPDHVEEPKVEEKKEEVAQNVVEEKKEEFVPMNDAVEEKKEEVKPAVGFGARPRGTTGFGAFGGFRNQAQAKSPEPTHAEEKKEEVKPAAGFVGRPRGSTGFGAFGGFRNQAQAKSPEPTHAAQPVVEEKKEEPKVEEVSQPIVEEKKEEIVPQNEPVAQAVEEPKEEVAQPVVEEKKEEVKPAAGFVGRPRGSTGFGAFGGFRNQTAKSPEPTHAAQPAEEKKEEPKPATGFGANRPAGGFGANRTGGFGATANTTGGFGFNAAQNKPAVGGFNRTPQTNTQRTGFVTQRTGAQVMKPHETVKEEPKEEPVAQPVEEKKEEPKVEEVAQPVVEEKKEETHVEEPKEVVEEKKEEVPVAQPVEEKKEEPKPAGFGPRATGGFGANRTGAFGGNTNTTGGFGANKTGFGANAHTNTTTAGGFGANKPAFGGNTTGTTGGFAAKQAAFGGSAAGTTGGFGANKPAVGGNTTTGGFGANKPAFGANANTNTTGGFAANKAAFGGSTAGTTAGGFGANKPAVGGNTTTGGFAANKAAFGGSTTGTTAGGFGANKPAVGGNTTGTTTGGFAANKAAFGGSTTGTTTGGFGANKPAMGGSAVKNNIFTQNQNAAAPVQRNFKVTKRAVQQQPKQEDNGSELAALLAKRRAME